MSLGVNQLLYLTQRESNVEGQIQARSFELEAVTRDLEKITNNYSTATRAKVMKMSNNNGVSFSDISYSSLMRPSGANNNKPMILADSSGRIVIDKAYRSYAEQISPNGASGGDYSGDKRLEILSSITGISKDKIGNNDSTSAEVAAAKEVVDKAKTARDKINTYEMTAEEYMNKYIDLKSLGINGTDEVNASNASDFAAKISSALGGKNYFPSSVTSKFPSYCTNFAAGISGDITMTGEEFVSGIIEGFFESLGSSKMTVYADRNGNSTLSAYQEADKAYQDAVAAYQAATEINAGILSGPEQKQIDFYDQIFTAIADNGWTYDENLNDDDYLNQMLQNGSYYFTTMTEDTSDDDDDGTKYDYSFTVASNCKNIFTVSDTDARETAFAEYQAQKLILNNKESKINKEMKNLESELAAIKKMKESCEQITEENYKRFFGLFA